MRSILDAWEGIKTYAAAHHFIMRHKLWGYIILPGLINIVLFIGTLYYAWGYSTELTNYLLDNISFINRLSTSETTVISFILEFTFRIVYIMIYLSIFKYVILLIMSPVLSFLAERTYYLLTGENPGGGILEFFRNALRGIIIALRNMGVEICVNIFLFLCAFIPVIGFFAPLLMFFVQAYFYGFSMLDYANERNNLGIVKSIQYIKENKGLAVGNGLAFYFLFSLPFIGWMIAPAYAVVAATIAQTPEHKILS